MKLGEIEELSFGCVSWLTNHNFFRYWARNFVGFPVFIDKKPNMSHSVLAAMEKQGMVGFGMVYQSARAHTIPSTILSYPKQI